VVVSLNVVEAAILSSDAKHRSRLGATIDINTLENDALKKKYTDWMLSAEAIYNYDCHCRILSYE
jgi:hypothetical protein